MTQRKRRYSCRLNLPLLALLAFWGSALPPVAAGSEPVRIMATWGGDEEAGFREVLDAFTGNTGIRYEYDGSRNIDILLKTRVYGGSPPDVAILPQFGAIVELVRQRAILPLSGERPDPILTWDELARNYDRAFIDLGTIDGAFYALPVKANSKSVCWYRPPSFRALGIEPPRTWQELQAIAEAHLRRGKAPFAIGGADGWPLTDWFENIYVRVAGPAMYRKLFLTHEVKWTDATVVEAMRRLGDVVWPEAKLAGGAEGTLSTGFIDAFNAVLRPRPAAGIYCGGGFMSAFAEQNFPALQGQQDYAFFEFPSIDPRWGRPVVVGGDFAVVFNDRPAVRRLIGFLAGKEASTIWASAERGAVVSPNRNVPLAVYRPFKRLEAQQLIGAGGLVFDGSDLAPSAVGRDAMVTALQAFVEEPERVREYLRALEGAAARSY
ncbi:MAG: extracellular solute-binding protein [Candidatus Lambdaproteobacteria bacterium]|nr:extracellular solute-binding protein [Candidatus Lambdaproteobacteria bacterium]